MNNMSMNATCLYTKTYLANAPVAWLASADTEKVTIYTTHFG